MNFHAEFFPKPFNTLVDHTDKLLLVGSCFTEQVGGKLASHKFRVLENPNGILFNPISISRAIISYAAGARFTEDDLFLHNEIWGSWQHHTRFSNIDKQIALQGINDSQSKASAFIQVANWIFVTLGSAFVYENLDPEKREVVANCHKVAPDKFYRRLLDVQEIKQALSDMMETVKAMNPLARFIYTISPVRHLREGFIENNRSKAALIQAVHALTDNEQVFYFPAYELVIDDLRDYRFYAEDMVHPNYAATNYVWEKFIETCISPRSRALVKEVNVINAARQHKAFNPTSAQHQRFLAIHLEKAMKLQAANPDLDFSEELSYFGGK